MKNTLLLAPLILGTLFLAGCNQADICNALANDPNLGTAADRAKCPAPKPTPTPTPTPTPSPIPTPTPTPSPTPTPTPKPTPTPADPSAVIRGRWEGVARDGALWSKHVYEQLPLIAPKLLSTNISDAANFCPNYANLNESDKKNFWVYLISSVAELESSFDPTNVYTESFRDQNGDLVTSNGLLQVSIGDASIYGCDFKQNSDMFDPYKNLDCGMIILNKWIGSDKVISGKSGSTWIGGARYWSTLRSTSLTKVQNWEQALPMCGK